MDISGITSAYADYYTTMAKDAAGAELSGKLQQTDKNATEEELMGVCKQFEAYLLEQVFKRMESTVIKANPDEDASTSQLVDFFKGQTLQEIANQSADTQSLGIAQMLYEQLKVNMGLSEKQVSLRELEENEAASGTAVTETEEA
ncbi:MAG: rod-binding protein [Lachnospiraceae bacterium]|nr:rod-binding protein [Lachnospiraceae bacterium]